MEKKYWNTNRLVLAICGLAIALVLSYDLVTRKPPYDGDLSITLDGPRAYLNGTMGANSYGQIRRFVNQNPGVQTLVFQSMSGTVDLTSTHGMGYFLRDKGLNTHLEARSSIASGAVDLFASGVRRTMECGARVGVHAWSEYGFSGNDLVPNENSYEHRNNIRYFDIMGLNGKEFYWFTMNAAPPAGIYLMSVDEINRFDLVTEPLDCG